MANQLILHLIAEIHKCFLIGEKNASETDILTDCKQAHSGLFHKTD